jgi:hypothetical protein
MSCLSCILITIALFDVITILVVCGILVSVFVTTRNRLKYKGWSPKKLFFISLLAAFVLPTITIGGGVTLFVMYQRERFEPRKFSEHTWMQKPGERLRMVHDLAASGFLLNKDTNFTKKFLGEPFQRDRNNQTLDFKMGSHILNLGFRTYYLRTKQRGAIVIETTSWQIDE